MLGRLIVPIIIAVVVVVVAVYVFIVYRIYKTNTSALDIYKGATQIQPKRSSFTISWFIFIMAVSIPQLIIIWFLPIGREFFTFILFFLPVFVILNYFPAYPYYTVVLHEGKIIGATLWGWTWKRTEINVNEIDKDKALRQNLGKSLGITVFEKKDGTKILTLGLDNLQIRNILEYASENI